MSDAHEVAVRAMGRALIPAALRQYNSSVSPEYRSKPGEIEQYYQRVARKILAALVVDPDVRASLADLHIVTREQVNAILAALSPGPGGT